MRIASAAAAALLLAAGCTAQHPQASRPGAGHSDGTAVSTVPVTSSAAVHSGATAPVPRTRQVVVRPVTATGRVAAGYTTTVSSADHRIDCGGGRGSYAAASPVTVDAGPVTCGPSSEYALACWNGPTATLALCYRDPWQRQVVQLRTWGRLPAEPAPARPSPLGLVLSDGTRCSLRGGGAWATLDGHPELSGSYSCKGAVAVWAGSGSDGIDRFRALWRVRLAPMSGHGQLHVMTVRTAYFVGTARS